MSRYQPYPNYRQGKIEWLGEIPEHWEVGLLSSLFVDNKEKNAGMKNNNLLSLSYGRIIQKDIDTNEGLLPESFESYQIVHPGYIVLRLTDLQNDKKSLRTGFVKETGIITSAYTGLAKKSKSIGDERYFHLYLHTFDLHKGFYGMGAGVRQGLNFDELKKLKFLLPPTNEQTLIADFLDRETAKIDTLIAKQERMIELLNEKRSALISHAVTKGLDPNVKMKDSGVEWLGEVPEHWKTAAIKHIVSTPVTDGPHETPDFVDEGVPFISAEAISKGILDFDKQRGFITEELNKVYSQKYSPQIYDIYMIKSGATTGVTAIVETQRNFNIWSPLAVIRCDILKADPYFILNFMRSRNFLQAIELGWSFGTQQNIGMGVIENIPVTLPPIEEQHQIATYLQEKNQKMERLIAKANIAIDLLKERRTALISAAVTGKIDVREAV